MSRFTLTTDQDVARLRRRIAAGKYAVNAGNVADSIVRKLREVNRARRMLIDDREDDRTRAAGAEPPPDPAAPPPARRQSDR
ncbi:MAG: flagellar biosynthesis anti-sigma factor FlgM [Solirubrobacterales bacterium]